MGRGELQEQQLPTECVSYWIDFGLPFSVLYIAPSAEIMAFVVFPLELLRSFMMKGFKRGASGVPDPLGGLPVDGSQALREVKEVKTAQGSW